MTEISHLRRYCTNGKLIREGVYVVLTWVESVKGLVWCYCAWVFVMCLDGRAEATAKDFCEIWGCTEVDMGR